MAELIDMPCGMWTGVGPRNHVLDGGPDPHTQRGNFEGENGRAETCPVVDILKGTWQEAAPIWCRCQFRV